VILPAVFFSNVVNYYQQLASHPAYSRVSLLDSSRATFLNHNRYPGSVNDSIDYYDKGMLVAFDLDAALRTSSPAGSLDRAFAGLYRTLAGRGDGFTHPQAAEVLAGEAPQAAELIGREVERPAGLTVVESLRRLGFEIVEEDGLFLGLVLSEKVTAEIANVVDDGPAGRSGLAPGDVIERVNGFPFRPKALAWATVHERQVTLQVKRGGRSLGFAITPAARRQICGLLWKGAEVQASLLREWLGRDDFRPGAGEAFALAWFDNFHGIQKVI